MPGVRHIPHTRGKDVLGNVSRLESHFQAGLSDIRKAHPTVLEWRGSDYLYVVEFPADREADGVASAVDEHVGP